jgi:hypothetical protein
MIADLLLLVAFSLSAGTRSAPAPVAFDRTVDDARLVLLCDPQRFRLSIRSAADRASIDESYPRRLVVDPNALVAMFPDENGTLRYRYSLVRHESCGPFVVTLTGDFLNSNVDGEMGALPPFASVHVTADNRWIYPDRPKAIRLTECDTAVWRWEDCPAGYAVRVDFTYKPPDDDRSERGESLFIRAWVRSGDVLGGATKMSKRASSVHPGLWLWWSRTGASRH